MNQPQDLLGPPVTQDYVPSTYWGGYYSLRKAPPFSLSIAIEMLTDPRIIFGLWLLKGPILSKSKFFVDCANEEVKEFLKTSITRFWRMSALKALKALEWGYACSEVLYHEQDGQIQFNVLKDLHPMDVRCITQKGSVIGASVRNVPNNSRSKTYIQGARCFWSVHSREVHRWYGRSRLFGAYLPWLESWTEGGCRDIRRLYFHKYAYGGEIGYAPTGLYKLDTGEEISGRDLMRDALEKKKSGGIMVFPNIPNPNIPGQYAWEVKPPQLAPPPEQIMEYVQDLRTEILEGLGIPPEIVRAEGTGAYSGRSIPMEAFYSILQEILNWTMEDFHQQILRVLVELNFGKVAFEIVPFGLSFSPTTPSDQKAAAAENQPEGESYSLEENRNPVSDEPPLHYKRKHTKTQVRIVEGLAMSIPITDEVDLPTLAFLWGIDIHGIDIIELRMGMKVEQEHLAYRDGGNTTQALAVAYNTNDVMKIAVTHLREDPAYYTHLAKMEKEHAA